jgi:hypothetical protein
MVNASEVFAKVGAALGSPLKWLPDGETGERADWITWLEPLLAEHPKPEAVATLIAKAAKSVSAER